jgi:hypothetical protein
VILEVFNHQKVRKENSKKLPHFYTWFLVCSRNTIGFIWLAKLGHMNKSSKLTFGDFTKAPFQMARKGWGAS